MISTNEKPGIQNNLVRLVPEGGQVVRGGGSTENKVTHRSDLCTWRRNAQRAATPIFYQTEKNSRAVALRSRRGCKLTIPLA